MGTLRLHHKLHCSSQLVGNEKARTLSRGYPSAIFMTQRCVVRRSCGKRFWDRRQNDLLRYYFRQVMKGLISLYSFQKCKETSFIVGYILSLQHVSIKIWASSPGLKYDLRL